MTRKTRKTHKMRKVLLAVCCAALLVCVTIGATVAYLTSKATVTNTFTVGNVKITLDEAKVNTNGEALNADGKTEEEYNEANPDEEFVAARVTKNAYKLLPGHTYTKDPTIHVGANSEKCWLFVKVENGIAAIEDTTTVAAQMTANGWTPVPGTENIYAYENIASAGANVKVFDYFKIKGSVVNEPETTAGQASGKQYLQQYDGKNITVTAYAVQADGFGTAQAAWEATFGK